MAGRQPVAMHPSSGNAPSHVTATFAFAAPQDNRGFASIKEPSPRSSVFLVLAIPAFQRGPKSGLRRHNASPNSRFHRLSDDAGSIMHEPWFPEQVQSGGDCKIPSILYYDRQGEVKAVVQRPCHRGRKLLVRASGKRMVSNEWEVIFANGPKASEETEIKILPWKEAEKKEEVKEELKAQMVRMDGHGRAEKRYWAYEV
ncbi:hypothetical protein BKA70DRAFT_1237865 [Coprinopsis sp. MPI-PUGE-AT-0042]|nr:hypothetical protein BKA70DRAFT_1237865 [Coprinopsis sp. MPI-PUGE-AT-0042]